MAFSARRLFAILAVSTALFACGDDDFSSDASIDSSTDAALDTRPIDASGDADSGPECSTDEECDDGLDCTESFCSDLGECIQTVRPSVCDDGVFCNGRERCDLELGCVPGTIETCNDGDVCTIDRCDEEAKMCVRTPRDFDGDGEADFFCEGGTDCDDTDPTRGSLARERCSDGVDNDCDELVDEADCGRPDYDTCEDPLDVTAGGVFTLSAEGAVADHELSCVPAGRSDLVARFEISEPRSVRIEASASGMLVSAALQTECGAAPSEIDCKTGFPSIIRARSLEPGIYFVMLAASGGEFDLEVEFGDPLAPIENATCEEATDVGEGGVFRGSLVDATDDVETGCGLAGAPDMTYSFTLEEAADVRVSATSTTGRQMAVTIAETCGGETFLRCSRGRPASGRAYSLDPGTYSLVVEASPSEEPDFVLNVDFEEPTAPPEGDTCSTALALPVDTMTPGTLAGFQDDVPSCGGFARDAIYYFDLEESRDVVISADAEGPRTWVSLLPDCTVPEDVLRCETGNPGEIRVRNLEAGRHYVLVEALTGTGLNVAVETSEPTTPIEVSGNETCESAHELTLLGGLYHGDTSGNLRSYTTRSCGSEARAPDAAFVLDLRLRRRVLVTTAGSSFDTVVHRHLGMCESSGEESCNDDGGDRSASVLDEILDPGLHYYIVDGWGDFSSGEYFFEVVVDAP